MKLEPKETQIIDMLFLELSQFTSAKTAKELASDIKIAQLERERDEARALLATMTQAVGLLTTLHGSMEIDVEHPVEMAQQIHAHVLRERDKAVALLKEVVRFKERHGVPV